MVIKDTLQPSARHWRDPANWRDRLPREIRIHQLVEERRVVNPEMCRHLIHFLGYRLHMEQRRYRLYLEFCSSGNLYHAMSRHHQRWAAPVSAAAAATAAAPAPASAPARTFLPEGYLWYVIKALASACLVLQRGVVEGDTVEDWRPITHLDLQTNNIFLHFKQQDEEGTALVAPVEEARSSKRKRVETITSTDNQQKEDMPQEKKSCRDSKVSLSDLQVQRAL